MKCEFNHKFSIDIFQNLEQKHAAIRWLNTCFDDISTWESLFQMIPDTGFQYTLCWHPSWTCMHIAMTLDAWEATLQQGETIRLDINCLNQNHPCMDLQATKRNNNCKYFVLYIICQEVTMVTYDDF